jgi:hypothetical protein
MARTPSTTPAAIRARERRAAARAGTLAASRALAEAEHREREAALAETRHRASATIARAVRRRLSTRYLLMMNPIVLYGRPYGRSHLACRSAEGHDIAEASWR